MNWVFYSLLLCNGLLFVWHCWAHDRKSAEVVAVIPVSSTVKELLLLSEVDPRELRPRARALVRSVEANPDESADQQTGDAAARSLGVPACYSFGPVGTDDEVEQLRAWVVAAGGAPRLRRVEHRELALQWVYLPPFSTRSEAVQAAQAMARSGIKDIFVIPRGDMAHAVSLGVYAQNVSLERRLRQLKAKGYEVSVLPRYRVEETSWIDAQFPGPNGFAQQRFNARFSGTEAVMISCQTMLSEKHSEP